MIKVNGRECWTLFDTGARNTYVTADVASVLTTAKTRRPFRSALGGTVKETTLRQACPEPLGFLGINSVGGLRAPQR